MCFDFLESAIKKKLKAFSRWILDNHQCQIKYFVDTAPVMEKPLAMQAGIGWQGKHTNIVSKEYGSWLFLSSIFLDIRLKANSESNNHCGTCNQCIDICPTNAIIAPATLSQLLVKVSPTPNVLNINCLFKPTDPVWDFTVGALGQFLFNPVGGAGSSSTDFELDISEKNNLVINILKYCGIIINDPTVIQVAEQESQQASNNVKS